MGALERAIAGAFDDPSQSGVPDPPAAQPCRLDCGGVAPSAVVHEGRYGGDGWDEHVDEWFDREMLTDENDLDQETIDAAREELKGEFLGRQIDADELDRRERKSQRMLLDHIGEDLIRERASELEGTETTHAN